MEPKDIVERLALGAVEHAVAVAALGKLFALRLVGFVVKVDAVEESFHYFAGEVSGIVVFD